MNYFEGLFNRQLADYGGNQRDWPLSKRGFLLLMLWLSPRCRRQFTVALCRQKHIAAETIDDLTIYSEHIAELAVSANLQALLRAIPLVQEKRPILPLWKMSVGAAMASLLLGLVLGMQGFVGDYAEPGSGDFEAINSYEVSQWLAGTE
jgi:hypothetical protein